MEPENTSLGSTMGLNASEVATTEQVIEPNDPPRPKQRPIVVGLYGIPGSGKSTLLRLLESKLGRVHFEFYEGSDVINNLTPGGLNAFTQLKEEEKAQWREQAIDKIGAECSRSGRMGVVTGHFMFWPEGEDKGQCVFTEGDSSVYTHIIYLDVHAEEVHQRRLDDTKRHRTPLSVQHLQKWQQTEKAQLRTICRSHGILFSLGFSSSIADQASMMLEDFGQHTEDFNLACAVSRLEDIVARSTGSKETVLVLDADKTLAAEDTGILFWKTALASRLLVGEENALQTLFDSALGYSYTAFRQASLLYEEIRSEEDFNFLCTSVASSVTLYPEFKAFLQLMTEHEHILMVVVTCGIRRIWEKIIDLNGLTGYVKVIGGGRVADGFVVTPEVKRALVMHLREKHGAYVWAFGDSILDLGMMQAANEAVVVVGDEMTRSKSMDSGLAKAIAGGLRARQLLLPSDVSPRLDTSRLPKVHLSCKNLIDSVLCRRRQVASINLLHATEKPAAKLLMTPMRDARVQGPALREAHQRAGWYLAVEFLTHVIGTEEEPIPHVQGHTMAGHRLLLESQTIIVPLMRGGEAMAFGISDAFPLAMFVHAYKPADLDHGRLHGRSTLVLVDSVINTGKSITEFIQHVRDVDKNIRIIVVAGVVQAECVKEGVFAELLSHDSNITVVALRLSDNKFTGRKGTDTGNRLFSTTQLL